MGNEMGNNNTSGLREEDSSTVEAQAKSLQEPAQANEVKAENHVVPIGESKDYHEKDKELPSNDEKGVGDSPGHDQESNRKGQEKNEVYKAVESELETKSSDLDYVDSVIQPVVLSEKLEEHEKPGSMSEEILSVTRSNHLEKQAKEMEEMINSTLTSVSVSHDLEHRDLVELMLDQHESTKPDGGEAAQDKSNSLTGAKDALGSSSGQHPKESHYQLKAYSSENLEGNLVDRSNEDVEDKTDDFLEQETASEDDQKSNKEIGNGSDEMVQISSVVSSDVGVKSELEFCSSGMNNHVDLPPETNYHVETSLSEDRCMELMERKESKSEENEHNHELNQFSDKEVTEFEVDKAIASLTNSLIADNLNANEKDDLGIGSLDPAVNGDCRVEEAKAAENGYCIHSFNESQNDDSEENSEDSKAEAMMFPELELKLPVDSSIANIKEESKAESMMFPELELKLPVDSSIANIKEESKAESMMFPELELKLAVDSSIANIKINEEDEDEPTEKQIVEEEKEKNKPSSVTEEPLASQTIPVQAESYLPCTPASMFWSEDQQQKTISEPQDAQSGSESSLKLMPESCSDLFVTMASTVHTASSTVETSVESEIDKPQPEVSHYKTAAPKTVIETKSSASASPFNEQSTKVETSLLVNSNYEAQENVISTGLSPDNLKMYAEMRKSPSFDLDLRIESRCEESDQTPLLYQEKTTIDSLSSQADIILQTPLLRQKSLGYQAMPVEEKVITLERGDTEKSRTPFLGFSKEVEEANAVITPNKQDNNSAATKKVNKDLWNFPTKEVASPSPKGKEKHKRRSPIFGSCICCATVIN